MNNAIPGLVVLGSTRKQAEQVMVSKSVSNTPPWPLLQFLPPGSCLKFHANFALQWWDLRAVSWNKPFPL